MRARNVFVQSLLLAAIIVFRIDARAQNSVSVPLKKDGEVSIFKRDIEIMRIGRQSLYQEMLSAYKKWLQAKELYDICSEKVSAVQCWQMYGDDIKKSKTSFPYSLRSIIYDPLYLVIRYRSVSLALAEAGQYKKDFVVCLNPKVPKGYWQEINRFKPILKSIPDVRSSDPREILKRKICAAYSVF
mgnify:CR=1 FL=1